MPLTPEEAGTVELRKTLETPPRTTAERRQQEDTKHTIKVLEMTSEEFREAYPPRNPLDPPFGVPDWGYIVVFAVLIFSGLARKILLGNAIGIYSATRRH